MGYFISLVVSTVCIYMFVLLCFSDKMDPKAAASGDKKQKKGKGKKEGASSSSSQFPTYMEPPPAFIAEREAIWADLRSKYEADVAAKPHTPIKITLPDGKVVDGEAWSTTPYDVAKESVRDWQIALLFPK